MTEGSADDVKKTFKILGEVFEAFHIPSENFKTNFEDDDDLEEGVLSQRQNKIS